MTARTAAILKALGYATWFFGCTLFFVWLTFPMDRVRTFVERKASESLGADVSIDGLELKGISRVEFWDVSIATRPKSASAPPQGAEGATQDATAEAAEPAASPSRAVTTKIDFVGIDFSPFELASAGPKNVRLDLEAFGGSVEDATFTIDGADVELELPKIAGILLEQLEAVQAGLPFPLAGKLSGQATVTWRGKLYDSTATIELKVADAVIREPVIKSGGYGDFELTDIQLGTMYLTARLGKKKDFPELRALPGSPEQTIIHLERWEASGEDIDLIGEERNVLQLSERGPMSAASLSAGFAFHFNDAFYDRTIMKGGVEETPNRFLRTIMSTDKRFKTAEKNGYFGLACRGSLAKPDCGLTRPSVRVGGQRLGPTGTGDEGLDQEPTDAPGDLGAEAPSLGATGRARPSALRGLDEQPPPPQVNPEPQFGAQPTLPDPARAQEVPRQPLPSTAEEARARLEELRRQREERMAQLREERLRLAGQEGGEAARDEPERFGVQDDLPIEEPLVEQPYEPEPIYQPLDEPQVQEGEPEPEGVVPAYEPGEY